MRGGTPEEEAAYWKEIVVRMKDILNDGDFDVCIVGLQQQLLEAQDRATFIERSLNEKVLTLHKRADEAEKEAKQLRAQLEALRLTTNS